MWVKIYTQENAARPWLSPRARMLSCGSCRVAITAGTGDGGRRLLAGQLMLPLGHLTAASMVLHRRDRCSGGAGCKHRGLAADRSRKGRSRGCYCWRRRYCVASSVTAESLPAAATRTCSTSATFLDWIASAQASRYLRSASSPAQRCACGGAMLQGRIRCSTTAAPILSPLLLLASTATRLTIISFHSSPLIARRVAFAHCVCGVGACGDSGDSWVATAMATAVGVIAVDASTTSRSARSSSSSRLTQVGGAVRSPFSASSRSAPLMTSTAEIPSGYIGPCSKMMRQANPQPSTLAASLPANTLARLSSRPKIGSA
jgi:hypothetical protein